MRKLICLLFATVILATTCNDPVFFAIFQEVKPTEARIKGTPTNMTVFTRYGIPTLYVASGKIHWYTGQWDQSNGAVPQPIGKNEKVVGLAATSTHLYALCLNTENMSSRLWRIANDAGSWELIPHDGAYLLQSVFATKDDHVFVGAMSSHTRGTPCAIFYVDGAGLVLIKSDINELLSGAASSGTNYYLSTKNMIYDAGNIYHIANIATPTDITPLAEDLNGPCFMSIISLENGTTPDIMAIARSGWLYHVQPTEFTPLTETGNTVSGALALWREESTSHPALLLTSIQGAASVSSSSRYTNGYHEAVLSWSGDTLANRDALSYRAPGNDNPTTIIDLNYSRYMSSIGTYPVYHMLQTPASVDPAMPLFASTSTGGLWSYRWREKNNSKGWQWNAEE